MSKHKDLKPDIEASDKPATPTRKYFAPTIGVTVEAADQAEAVVKAKKKVEVGDERI